MARERRDRRMSGWRSRWSSRGGRADGRPPICIIVVGSNSLQKSSVYFLIVLRSESIHTLPSDQSPPSKVGTVTTPPFLPNPPQPLTLATSPPNLTPRVLLIKTSTFKLPFQTTITHSPTTHLPSAEISLHRSSRPDPHSQATAPHNGTRVRARDNPRSNLQRRATH